MKIAIVGGGSVGLLLAARLANTETDLNLLVRTKTQADQLRERGITCHLTTGEKLIVPVKASVLVDAMPPADLYLLTVKQTDLPTVVSTLHTISAHARVVAFQNGLGHQELLEEVLRFEQLYFAINTEGARRLSPQEVAHTGTGTLRIGPLDKSASHDPLIEQFIRLAEEVGIPAIRVEETRSFLWRKLLANAVINPLTALFEIKNGQLLEREETIETMRRLFLEAALIAKSQGQEIMESDWQEILAICRNTSQNYSSMLQDLWNNKPTEIDAITGYITRIGKRQHVSTPLHDALYRVVSLKTRLQLPREEAKHAVSR